MDGYTRVPDWVVRLIERIDFEQAGGPITLQRMQEIAVLEIECALDEARRSRESSPRRAKRR